MGQIFLKAAARRLVARSTMMRLERRVVFVEGDEHLLAEGRQRMEMERERHDAFPLMQR